VAYLVAVVLLTVSSLALCYYFDRSPKVVLRAAIRHLLKRPDTLEPMKGDAPYRRIKATHNAVHHPVLLNLETSEGSGQAAHPDVVHIPEGFGLKNWTYWMVCTPYPYAQSKFENPEIFVSYDGIFWMVPDGVDNPLVPTPKTAGDHNSDPDVVFYEKKLWLFYRETLRSKTPKKVPNQNTIYLMKSADGIRWSAPIGVLSEKTGTQLLSPAVIHDGTCFVMWTVEIHPGGLGLMRRISSDAVNWDPPEPCEIIGLDKGRHPWHIDVIREKDRLSAALVSYLGPSHSGGEGSRIHYAHSEDEGLIWSVSGFLFEQVYEFESQLQYRAGLQLLDEERQVYGLWYSAASLADMFSIAYVTLAREGNRLLSPKCDLRKTKR
jgi:hypothetical protein